MKRVILRIGCGAVCAALALTLGCGCALLPARHRRAGAASSAVSVPTDDSGKPLYDPAVLNDGRLRVLYCDGRSGSSTTILCGSTPLHQAARQRKRLAGGGQCHRHRRLLAAQLVRPHRPRRAPHRLVRPRPAPK